MIKTISLLIFVVYSIVQTGASVPPSPIITIDPWDYSQRVWMYDTILNATRLPSLFGQDNLGNYLWGLPLQLGWQNYSGRLAIKSGRIDEFSWWADINYYLSTIPYLAAMDNGIVPVVTFKPPTSNNATKFCVTVAGCSQQVIADWKAYFSAVQSAQQLPPGVGVNGDELLRIMWVAHTTSIQTATPLFTNELSQLGLKESKFGNGWAHFVEVLSIVQFNTNHSQVATFEQSLPPRRLRLLDIPPFIPDMSSNQNNVITVMFAISDMSKLTLVWDGFLATLTQLLKKPQCRALVQSQFQSFIQHPIQTFLTSLIEILGGC